MVHGLFLTNASFCVPCHSNRGFARALARAREKLSLVQFEFAYMYSCKPKTSRDTIYTPGFASYKGPGLFKPSLKPSSYKPRLILSSACVRRDLAKMYSLYGKMASYVRE